MGDVDPKIMKKTQDTLGKLIKKPPLTEKLLSKPPFRFLHDIMTSVIKSTGFMKGLFSESEMNSENVKDKENKVGFLQKVIDIVSMVVEKPIAARPSKIVAGHEADKTNEFLQALAEAISKKPDNDAFVKRVLKGEKFTEKSKGNNKAKEKTADQGKDQTKDQGKDQAKDTKASKPSSTTKPPQSKSPGKSGVPAKADHVEEKHSKDRGSEDKRKPDKEKNDKQEERDRSRHREEKRGDRSKDRESKERESKDSKPQKEERFDSGDQRRHMDDKTEADLKDDGDQQDQQEGAEVKSRVQRPTSAKGSRRRQGRQAKPESGDNTVDEDVLQAQTANKDKPPSATETRNRSARPGSARPAPRIQRKTEIAPEEGPAISSSNVPNIITDKKDSDDDDDLYITNTDEDPLATAQLPSTTIVHAEDEDDEDDEHGGLVKKILEKKKELEGGSQTHQQKTEIERVPQVSDAQSRKEREQQQREVDKLRSVIQSVTRSVNPLDRALNYIQEDIDAMQNEMVTWRKEHKENLLELQKEQSITDKSMEPLKAHLGELDSQIKDQLDLIAAVKAKILANDVKVQKMLGTFSQK